MPLKTFLIFCLFCSLREDNNHHDQNVILKLKLHSKVRRLHRAWLPPVGQGYAKVRISKPDTVSNCFIWSRGNAIPCGAHPETLSTRFEVSWMKNNVHPRSGTQRCSAEFTTRHYFKSLYVVSPTSNINITKIYSSSSVCGDWTSSMGLLLTVKQEERIMLNQWR